MVQTTGWTGLVEVYKRQMQTTGNKRHALVMRAPNADLARDPRWGRTEAVSYTHLSVAMPATYSLIYSSL